ncbi:hypothetical protein GCM10027514_05090 [Azotobacter armeniacus]
MEGGLVRYHDQKLDCLLQKHEQESMERKCFRMFQILARNIYTESHDVKLARLSAILPDRVFHAGPKHCEPAA